MSNPDACEPDSFVAEVGWLVQNGRVYVNAADLVDVLREADCGNLADDFLRIATEELAAHADRHGLAGFTVSASVAFPLTRRSKCKLS